MPGGMGSESEQKGDETIENDPQDEKDEGATENLLNPGAKISINDF